LGGGICVMPEGVLRITGNSLVTGNTASSGGEAGGGVYIQALGDYGADNEASQVRDNNPSDVVRGQ
jgi:hypothetical protein